MPSSSAVLARPVRTFCSSARRLRTRLLHRVLRLVVDHAASPSAISPPHAYSPTRVPTSSPAAIAAQVAGHAHVEHDDRQSVLPAQRDARSGPSRAGSSGAPRRSARARSASRSGRASDRRCRRRRRRSCPSGSPRRRSRRRAARRRCRSRSTGCRCRRRRPPRAPSRGGASRGAGCRARPPSRMSSAVSTRVTRPCFSSASWSASALITLASMPM